MVQQSETTPANRPASRYHRLRAVCLLAPALALPACSTVANLSSTVFGGGNKGPSIQTGFIGGIAADEPQAALAARTVLATGGNAADAAVAAGFMLSVTLPSRASLGGSGACLAYKPGQDSPQAIIFTPAAGGPGGDRPAAVPMMARGLYLLNVRYGSRGFASLIAPAEAAAAAGVPASRALVNDVDDVAPALVRDPAAAAIFAPNGAPITEGANLVETDLSGVLGDIRKNGVGDFYQGPLAEQLIAGVRSAGGGDFSLSLLRGALPRVAAPIILQQGDNSIAFLPAPADGGVAAAAAFQVLQQSPDDYATAKDKALAAAAASRVLVTDNAKPLPETPTLPALPASTSFVVIDNKGGAVGCAFTMNNLFGTGRVAPGTGIVLGASPAAKPSPLLAAAIAWRPKLRAFRAVATGTGQEGAPVAVASAINAALSGSNTVVPAPGRFNIAACDQYLPGNASACHFQADPRGAGLAITSE